MRSHSPLAAALTLLLLVLATSPGSGEMPYTAADPSAPPVTRENVLESDRFWPFRVQLVEEWTPPGATEPLRQIPGVLVRVESRETVRVDFGRYGRYQLPLSATDLLERANRVRLGAEEKMAPNLVLTLGSKMLDPSVEEPRRFRLLRDSRFDAILCVFADETSEEFARLVKDLRTFEQREDIATVLFPQGGLPDPDVWKRLRAIGWKAPFVIGPFTGPYRRSIAGDDVALPYLMLLTQEGRVLFRGPWSKGVAPEIEAALPSSASSAKTDAARTATSPPNAEDTTR